MESALLYIAGALMMGLGALGAAVDAMESLRKLPLPWWQLWRAAEKLGPGKPNPHGGPAPKAPGSPQAQAGIQLGPPTIPVFVKELRGRVVNARNIEFHPGGNHIPPGLCRQLVFREQAAFGYITVLPRIVPGHRPPVWAHQKLPNPGTLSPLAP